MRKHLICIAMIVIFACSGAATAFADLDEYIRKTSDICQLVVHHDISESLDVIDYDQRNSRVAPFMDEVEYEGYPDIRSRVTEYLFLKQTDNSPSYGYTIDVACGQILYILDYTDLKLSRDPEIINEDGIYEIANLIPYHVYRIVLFNVEKEKIFDQFIRPIGLTNIIEAPSLPNVRDIGGLKVDGGMIKHGMIYRGIPCSNGLEKAEDRQKSMEILGQLGIKLEVDLRAGDELNWTEKAQAQAFGEGKSEIPGADYILSSITSYKRIMDPSDYKNQNIADALRLVMDSAVKGEPVYYHCAGGADRTGTVSFLLEGLLGASESDLDKEYELTSFAGGSRLRSNGGYVAMKKTMLEWEGETLQEKFHNWFLSSGFTEAEISAFREAMIVPDPTGSR